jgi:hypothetical protein
MPNYVGANVPKRECPVKCHYVQETSLAPLVDAVLFEASVWGKGHEGDHLRVPVTMPERLYGQQWINFGYETPLYFSLLAEPAFIGQMTLNMTYDRASSAVPISFACDWAGIAPHHLLMPPVAAALRDPSLVVAFMASNCERGGAIDRYHYVGELSRYISVHSYGRCHHNIDLPIEMQFPIYSDHGASMRNKIGMFHGYRFVLAFENSNTTDYVSEKLWNAFQSGALPVYMGSHNVEAEHLPAPHSLIETRHFSGPEALAKHLLYLIDNETAYQEYFAWRHWPAERLSPAYRARRDECAFTHASCRLCRTLADRRLAQARTDGFDARRSAALAVHVDGARVVPLPRYEVWLNGATQYGEVPHNALFNLRHSFTLMAWVWADSFSDQRIIDKNTAGAIDGFNFDIVRVWQRGYLRLCVGDACHVSERPLQTDNWHHVAVTVRSSDLSFFIDGREERLADAVRGDVAQNELPLRIGAANNADGRATSLFMGRLDDVALFQCALSAEQVRAWILGRPAGHAHIAKRECMIAWYDANNDKSGDDESVGIAGNMHDASGNELHGRWIGSARLVEQFGKALSFSSGIDRQ